MLLLLPVYPAQINLARVSALETLLEEDTLVYKRRPPTSVECAVYEQERQWVQALQEETKHWRLRVQEKLETIKFQAMPAKRKAKFKDKEEIELSVLDLFINGYLEWVTLEVFREPGCISETMILLRKVTADTEDEGVFLSWVSPSGAYKGPGCTTLSHKDAALLNTPKDTWDYYTRELSKQLDSGQVYDPKHELDRYSWASRPEQLFEIMESHSQFLFSLAEDWNANYGPTGIPSNFHPLSATDTVVDWEWFEKRGEEWIEGSEWAVAAPSVLKDDEYGLNNTQHLFVAFAMSKLNRQTTQLEISFGWEKSNAWFDSFDFEGFKAGAVKFFGGELEAPIEECLNEGNWMERYGAPLLEAIESRRENREVEREYSNF
jgi:hypothetical protein